MRKGRGLVSLASSESESRKDLNALSSDANNESLGSAGAPPFDFDVEFGCPRCDSLGVESDMPTSFWLRHDLESDATDGNDNGPR